MPPPLARPRRGWRSGGGAAVLHNLRLDRLRVRAAEDGDVLKAIESADRRIASTSLVGGVAPKAACSKRARAPKWRSDSHVMRVSHVHGRAAALRRRRGARLRRRRPLEPHRVDLAPNASSHCDVSSVTSTTS